MKPYYKRCYLNKGEGTANLEISYVGGYGHVKISDCNRQVTLSIDTSTTKEFKNSAYKIDKLISELTALSEILEGSA